MSNLRPVVLALHAILIFSACEPSVTVDPSKCGDGEIEGAEECEGEDLAGSSCLTLGFDGGELSCTEGCRFDRSGCTLYYQDCGNGTVEGAEECDGEDYAGSSCLTLGFDGGELSCTAGCRFDRTNCSGGGQVSPLCGDGIVEGAEQCEQGVMGSAACADFGFDGGVLGCLPSCMYDTSHCVYLPTCGDGVINAGEECEGENLNGQSCETLGYYGGSLACDASCQFNMTDCVPYGFCGDGTAQTSEGEVCDGDDFVGLDCVDYGYRDGHLQCNTGCGPDYSNCGPYLYTTVSNGGNSTCALDLRGDAWCWGANDDGELGNDSYVDNYIPTAVMMPANTTFSQIVVRMGHVCALDTTGGVWCWGANDFGQLGDGELIHKRVPTRVASPAGVAFEQVSAADTSSCALDTNGAVWCWGANDSGALGDGAGTDSATPVQVSVPAGVTFSQLHCGFGEGCCALTTEGAAYCWGNAASIVPEQVPSLPGSKVFTSIVSSRYRSCGIADDATAWCWGDSPLGDGVVTQSATPVQVAPFSFGEGIVDISIALSHVCLLTESGSRGCWGYNGTGYLGTGTTTPVTVDTPVQAMSRHSSLGDGATCTIISTGGVACWGLNTRGQTGLPPSSSTLQAWPAYITNPLK